jgi:hypothetical protein
MSSVIRRVSQIPVRTKYLLAVDTDTAAANAADSPAFQLESDASWPATVGTVAMPASVVNSNAIPLGITAGALYRDLGRQIIVADIEGKHLAHYRAAQLVSGAGSEGVGAFTEIYLRVWGANGENVRVARTG